MDWVDLETEIILSWVRRHCGEWAWTPRVEKCVRRRIKSFLEAERNRGVRIVHDPYIVQLWSAKK